MAFPSRLGAALLLIVSLAGCASMSRSDHRFEPRGRMVDIGGRKLRLVCEGPLGRGPTVVFEAGSFGGAFDWAVVQAKIADRMRACAYDRAGLGYSDPGPEPRDSEAVASDLAKLLDASDEEAPYILVGHSMAPVHTYLYALRHPDKVAGMVLVDATPPEAVAQPRVAGMVKGFAQATGFAPLAARLGLTAAADPFLGDPIGLPEPAKSEKRHAFASAAHNHWAAVEARDWLKDAEEARAAGELNRELPVAVINAGGGGAEWKALQAAPAKRSRAGYLETVDKANHASLLGPIYADAIVRGIEFVRKAALEKR